MKSMKHILRAWALSGLMTLATATPAGAADAPAANSTASAAGPVLAPAPAVAWPSKILPEVNYDGLPLSEVVKRLQDTFGDGFDVVLPTHWEGDGDVILPKNWLDTPITLQLKNVTAVEIFTAMNLYFQVNETPVQWELTANGSRPVAVLHVTVPPPPPAQGDEDLTRRHVFFVGDLIGNDKVPGMNMDDVVRTVNELYIMSFNQPPDKVIQASKEAQLIVVTGTEAELSFVDQTLQSLQQKVNLQRAAATTAGGATKSP
ncbi:MAG: hypothetical protein ABSH19_09345 [Opitutales bacterium]